jgi:CPA2 family monovalent cation:H+ antiporter-2
MDGFLLLSFVFLAAMIIAVPLASKLGLGSVLGFLIAGIALSPLLQTLGVDIVSIQHFAEFGVVMMLFLVGLELEPKMLWDMRARLLGLGGLQVVVTAALVTSVSMALGIGWSVALAIGLVLSLSSTAIVLQTLNEKGLMKSDGGQSSFSVLLFQDIAVIPMLAFIPLLALPELADMAHGAADVAHGAADTAHGSTDAAHADAGHGDDGHGGGDHGGSMSLVDGMAGWMRALVTIGAIGAVIVGGSLLTRPVFRYVAVAKLRELFTAAALAAVVGIALLMTLVGLSPALGTFLAGVVLANSEYRHELESDIEPFKGLLLGLFFITVGAGIDFELLIANIGNVVLLTVGLIALKAGVLLVLARIFGVTGSDKWLFALGLAQAGEFGFVLLSFTVANNVIPGPLADQLLLVVALSMLLTPGLFILYDRVIAPRMAGGGDDEADEITEEGSVIIAGHGRFGGIVNRMLLQVGYKTVVLDYSSAQLDMLRTFGFKAFFGDATRPDLLHAAGIESARMLVVAIDDREQATALVHYVHHNYPHVHIVARAIHRDHVYELYSAGCRDIIRDTFDSSVRAGRSAYEALGMHPYESERRARDFVRNDRKALAEMATLYDPNIPNYENAPYVARVKELAEEQERMMRGEPSAFTSRVERGWHPPSQSDVASEEAAAKDD